MKKNLIVLYGGKSVEHDISVITAIQTISCVDLTRYNVFPIYMKGDGFFLIQNYSRIGNYINFDFKQHSEILLSGGIMYELKKSKLRGGRRIDCALLCNHGGEGENGSLQGFLNICGIAYTSADVLGSSIGMNKYAQKILAKNEGITVPVAIKINMSDYLCGEVNLEEIFRSFEGKIIVKPVNLGSSIGITVADNFSSFKKAVDLVAFYDSDALAETFLEGSGEYNCTLCKTIRGMKFGRVEKVVKNHSILTFDDKYVSDGAKGMAGLTREYETGILSDEIKSISERLYKTFSLSGIVRMDYLYSGGKVYFNEVNTIPGSLSYYLYEEDFGNLLTEVIENAIMERESRNKMILSFSSSLLKEYSGFKLRK